MADDPAEGGDPVCWLDHVCPECSAFNDDPASPCWRCGTSAFGEGSDEGPID